MSHESPACASLPQTTVSLRATYCQHHQAWTLTWQVYHEVGGADITDVVPYTAVPFGPFDSVDDVLQASVSALCAALAASNGR